MSSRRKRRAGGGAMSLGVALLVLAAVLIGMFLPSLFSGIQSSRLEGLREAPELSVGELSLTSDEFKIERLALPQTILIKQKMGETIDFLELSAGRFMDESSAADKLDELVLLLQGTGLDMGSIGKKDLIFAQPILVMTEDGSAAGAVIWQLAFHKSRGPISENLSYIVDESTGLIIYADYNIYDQREYESGGSEYVRQDSSANYLQTLSTLAENMKKSYNFAQTEIVPQSIEGELSPSQRNFYISFVRDDTTMFSMSVLISANNWAINYQ